MVLGIVAMLVGLTAALAGSAVGLFWSRMLVRLPGGLPVMSQEAMAIVMLAIGILTMVLGGVSIYRSRND